MARAVRVDVSCGGSIKPSSISNLFHAAIVPVRVKRKMSAPLTRKAAFSVSPFSTLMVGRLVPDIAAIKLVGVFPPFPLKMVVPTGDTVQFLRKVLIGGKGFLRGSNEEYRS